jgi:uncharacterized protein (TIGR03085 family)
VATPNFARLERSALCDLLDRVGPDEPTLCTGWTTGDLAAHLVVRERRPDAAAGLVIRGLAGHMESVRQAEAAKPFAATVAKIRRPPRLGLAGLPLTDRLTNTTEFFIHHEDVRRAAAGWEPRPLDPALGAVLYRQFKTMGKLRLRKFPAAVAISAPGFGEIAVGAGGPAMTITGDPGELTLFFGGRKDVARLEFGGDEASVAKLRGRRFAI